MPEKNIDFKLTGWKALAAILVVVVIVGIRIASMGDMKNDTHLMEEVKLQLMTEYWPDDVERMKSLYESGDTDEFSKAAESITSTRLNIKSIKASYSIFDFSTKEKRVIVKVVYSIDNASGTRKQGTKYYLFKHSPLVNRWRYWDERGVTSYYLNFI